MILATARGRASRGGCVSGRQTSNHAQPSREPRRKGDRLPHATSDQHCAETATRYPVDVVPSPFGSERTIRHDEVAVVGEMSAYIIEQRTGFLDRIDLLIHDVRDEVTDRDRALSPKVTVQIMALREVVWVIEALVGMNTRSDRGQHAGEDLEPEVLFVAQPVGATLEHADLVVQALDEAERHLVLRVAVGGDAVPVPRDHCGKLLVGAEPLPLQSGAPVVEEAPGPALPLVLPELAEGLLEDVGGVEPLVRGEQRLESAPAVEREVLAVGEQRVLLALDEPPVPARQPRVLALADLIEGLAQVPQDVELVEQDARLGGVPSRRGPKRLPHVHHGEPNAGAFPRAEPGEEFIETRRGPILAAKPDRALSDEIAHHDAVGVALLDRDFVETEDRRAGRAGAAQLLAHVLRLQGLDRVPIEAQLLGHVADRGGPAAPADVEAKALRVERVGGEELEPFLLHRVARPAGHAPDFDVEVNARVATGEIADPPHLAVVPAVLDAATRATDRFFDRRTRARTRAFGSPKMPMTVGAGRNPGNRYASQSRRTGRGVGICA